MRGLVRAASAGRLADGCGAVVGDPLDATTFADSVAPADTYVQLVGVPHPSPSKAQQFKDVDLVSARESVHAARAADVRHFVFVSVAQPAPLMRAYQAARQAAEQAIAASGIPATILRPWYVLGPGHWWPLVLTPGYAVAERLAATRDAAHRLGLVTITQMVRALAHAVEQPASRWRVLDVPTIRAGRLPGDMPPPDPSY